MNSEKNQQLLGNIATELAQAIDHVQALGGAAFKSGISDVLTPLCRNGVKIFGVDKQIEDELTKIVMSTTTVQIINANVDEMQQANQLRWSIVVQELRTLKRKYPQQKDETITNNSNTSNNILPPTNSPLGQAIADSFLAIHFLVDTVSLIHKFGPDALSPILVQNLGSARKAASEWNQQHFEEVNSQGNDDSNERITCQKAEIKLILKNMFYHSDLNHNVTAAESENSENKKSRPVTLESSKSVLLSSEWLKVDSVFLMKNGTFLRHPLVTDFFTCPPSLLSQFRKVKSVMVGGEETQPLSQVLELLNRHRERRRQIVTTIVRTNNDDPNGNENVNEDGDIAAAVSKQQITAPSESANESIGNKNRKTIPIKFIASECMELILEGLAKVC